ncbi:MAG: hypothetical protein H7X92_11100 [Chitinophagales bacterium]|nr:hypothetical protein [Hyphomicrobiales bacterium]
MAVMSIETKTPAWFWAAAGLGLAWNAFGVVQYLGSVTATRDSLIASGLTAAQAEVMTTYPVWMTIAFAIGVFAGLAGCALLLLRNRLATPVFALSLAGYIVLFIGDITEGVFAALGAPQVAVLTMVVAIAAALLWMARHAERRGSLALRRACAIAIKRLKSSNLEGV